MTVLAPNIEKLIINNLKAALKDINKLTFRGYNFIYNASNFIAHYNEGGFRDYYGTGRNFAQDVIAFRKDNQYRNFSKEDAYMQQKVRIYNEVADEALRLYPELEFCQPYWG